MAQILVSPDVLNNYARDLERNAQALRDLLDKIRDMSCEFKQNWEGGEINPFYEKLNNCDKMSINELLDLCDQFSKYIRTVVDAYENTEMQLYNSFNKE